MRSYLYTLLAGMFILASCTNDTLQELTPGHHPDNPAAGTPEGTFLVDYTVDNGTATRATGDGKLQISSLDYYVYYATGGQLVKHRRIAIDPATQQWPLTRDNMTWEQRQALQDTLQCGIDYRILFIANIDPTLFNYDTYSAANPHPAVVKNDELYQNARILLPNVPFRDNNMYCLWEGTLKEESKQVVKRNDILLQRIVTRTDISRTENPTTLYDAIANGFYETNCKGNVESAVEKWINDFSTKINNCANNMHPAQDIRDYPTQVKELTDCLTANINLVLESYKKQLINDYVSIINESNIYTTRMQDWYQTERHVKAIYNPDTRANAISFSRISSHFDDSNADETPCEINEKGTVSIIGFAGGTNLNEVSSLDFYNSNATNSTFSITGTTFSIDQGINRWCEISCDPCAQVLYKNEATTQRRYVNLQEIMQDVSEWSTLMSYDNGNFAEALNYFWNGCNVNHHGGSSYFEDCSFTQFPIEASIPNLTAENVDSSIELIPSWAITQVTGE